jgi:ribokinase
LSTLPRIVVVGSSNTDFIIRLERIPRPGETLLGGEFLNAAGGKGANQAVAAARAGGAVSFVARVGRDSLGDQALANFVGDGIDVSQVTRDPRAASGAALIFVARNGENSIAVASGANSKLTPADVRKARPLIQRAKVLLMQLETPLPTVQAAARLGAASGSLVILNPAPARELPGSLLKLVSIITPNETEAELLTGIAIKNVASATRAAEKLRKRGVGTVVLTMGAAGALVVDEAGAELVPSFKVKAVDTTAAGDTFNGALAVALAEGQPLRRAVQFANAAAAISVTRVGAQPSTPHRKSIERLLRAR